MNIVFSADNNFVKQLAVAITSILKNSKKNESFNFFVLTNDISTESVEIINRLKLIKPFNIEFILIDETEFKNFPIYKHFKIPTWFRIALPRLLDLDKVLYMDCDIVVKKSLSSLYNIDLQNHYAVAVEDVMSENMASQIFKLGVKKYFNAGILLLNLKKLREENFEEKCIDFVRKNSEKILFVDQSVLNKLFEENVIFTNEKWNFQYNTGAKLIKFRYFLNYFNIAVLHFACQDKPWNLKFVHPATFLWFHYLSFTPFKVSFAKVLQQVIMQKVEQVKLSFKIFSYCLF